MVVVDSGSASWRRSLRRVVNRISCGMRRDDGVLLLVGLLYFVAVIFRKRRKEF